MYSKLKIPCILFALLLVFISCKEYTGTFAYRTVEMDHYEKLRDGHEFEQDSQIEWVFVPDTMYRSLSVGIVYLKKKAVWIDISTRTVPVTQENPNVYGTLVTEEPGEYQIQLVVSGERADMVRYTVYPAEESDPFEE